ncbi:MAG: TauD/TfdA family dioxygenase [Pseudomonadales bacterium]|nr:TauD/TfdA family dioxygenase [Pseudomonadales bacterium]
MSYQHIQVDTAVGPVGAIVRGADLSKPLDDAVREEIRDAWHTHHVLFFRNQSLAPADQAAFAAHFGDLDVYPFMKAVDQHPNVIPIIKEPDAKVNFGGGWHTDTSYLERPPAATVLYAVEVPDEGGDTLFADATAAYEDLSPGLRRMLDGVVGIYSPKIVHGKDGAYAKLKASSPDLGPAYGGNEAFAESEVEHPLIRTHPATGKKSIYCGRAHTHRIKDMTREESMPIITFLNEHLTQEKYVTRFKWEPGTLAMWDNRSVFHYAMNDYDGKRRHMHRVIVQGELPI